MTVPAQEPGEPFRRRGRAGVFAVEVTRLEGGPGARFAIALEHRDTASKPWQTIARTCALDPGVVTLSPTGLREELRFRFTVEGSGSADLRVADPIWLPDREEER